MASVLPSSHYREERDIISLGKAIGWQSLGYDEKMRHGFTSLTGMRPGDFIYFLAYALAGLVPPLSSFFFILLEHYRLQLQHLLLHSITQVAVFVHLCKMFMVVRPSVHLFCHFHVLCPTSKQPPCIGSYYFQHRTNDPSMYIATLTPVGETTGERTRFSCRPRPMIG
jgi:hypothetical protein